jgi:hypothetical protein
VDAISPEISVSRHTVLVEFGQPASREWVLLTDYGSDNNPTKRPEFIDD